MKSKKRLLPALMVFVVAFCCLLLAGCTRNPADIEILSGEIVCEVNAEDIQPDWSSVRAKITFEDGTQETVGGADLVFSHIDVSTAGQKVVQVGYKEGSFRKNLIIYVVESKTINATVTGYNATYDGSSHPAVTVQGTLSGDNIMYKLEGSSTWVQSCPEVKNAGETTVMVRVTREHCQDFETTVKATVAKKNAKIKGRYYTYTFGQSIPTTFAYDIEGLVDGETKDVWSKQPTISTNIEDSDKVADKVKVGYYSVIFSGAEADNYVFEYLNGTIVVEKASYNMSDVRWSDTTIEYEEGVEKEVTLLNLPEGVIATYTGNKATNIGDYTATAELQYDSENYNAPRLPDGVELTHDWSIAEYVDYTKIAMPTANTTIFTYNGQDQTYLPNGFDDSKMYISNNVHKTANETGYTVTISLKDGFAWEDANVGEGRKNLTFNFAINKLTAQLSWGETILYYTGEIQSPTCTVTNVCEGDTCNVIVSGGQTNANASYEGAIYVDGERYTATASSLDNDNYKLPEGENATQFDIRQAENSWTTTPSIEVSKIDGVLTPIYTGNARFGYEEETVKHSFKLSTAEDSTYSEALPSEDGEYFVKFVIEGTSNYTEIVSTCKFYISNAVVESMYSDLLATRNSNLGVESENFEDKTRPIFAGQQNYFDFQMIGNVNGESGIKEIVEFSTTIKAYIKGEDSSYTELDSTSLSTYISEINNFKNYVVFNEEAIGKTFKFEIAKAGITGITMEVQVVNGYNAYNADDLCVINNKVDTSNNEVRGWADKKAGTKYDGLTVNSIVLQKDITIADSNIPSEFFYTAEEASGISATTNLTIVGSMKDGDGNGAGGNGRAIYERNVVEGETFSIYGNYFTIDYSGLTRCVVESGNKSAINTDDVNGKNETLITTHATVFKFNGLDTTAGQTGENAGTVNFLDVRIKGNGERSNRSIYSGGIMAGKLNHINANVTNSIYKNTFIGFLIDDACANGSQTRTTFLNTKGYDCYNTLIYSYGVSNFTIKGGEYLRAGGPVMIVDHVGGSKVDGTGGIPSNVTVIGAKMESFVTGNEPWFVSYGATALFPQIVARNNNYLENGSTFLIKENGISNLMNLKVVYKSSSAEGLTAQPVRGEVIFYDSQEEYDACIKGDVNRYGLNMTSYSKLSSADNSNRFQNSYNAEMLGATTYLLVPNLSDTSTSFVVKFANIMAFQAAATEKKLDYIEGYVIGGNLLWGKDPATPTKTES
ncbi:MAG: MBG domain-containing protein, partial [Christensenellales bacterium]